MQSTETKRGCVAQEPTAEPARATESESDGERVSETGSSMGSAKKMPNSWNLVLEKFCASKAEEDIKGLEEARDNFLEDKKKKNLDFLIILLATRAPVWFPLQGKAAEKPAFVYSMLSLLLPCRMPFSNQVQTYPI